ncbi:MAG: hypothetical protein HN522_05185 [Flavobacteriales bacterium]|nr:hypothetical protein [Flavobacteriales bacterium]
MKKLLLILLCLPFIGFGQNAKFKVSSGDKINGVGTITFPEGSIYIGAWKNSQRNGFGTNYWKTESKTHLLPAYSKYKGEWLDDRMHGYGKVIYENGDSLIGKWEKGYYFRAIPVGRTDTNFRWSGYGAEWFARVDEEPKLINKTYSESIALEILRIYENLNKSTSNWSSGQLFYSFFIDTSGFVRDVSINRGIDKYKDAYLIKAINSLPRMIPAKVDGKPVIFKFSSSLIFYSDYPTKEYEKSVANFYKDNYEYVLDTFPETLPIYYYYHCCSSYKYPIYSMTYVKKMLGNCYNGTGYVMWINGHSYIGEWKNGIRQGFGKYSFSNGDVLEGEWQNNKIHGTGKRIFSDSSKYIGDFKNDKRNGYGKYINPSGDTYIGNWSNGLKNGEGIKTYTAGGIKKYEGEWKENTWHGNGVATYASGEIKKGRWKDNILVGEWEEIPSVSSPAILTVTDLQFQDANQNDLLEANESSSVSFKLKNIGKGTAYAIEINIKEKSSVNGLEYLKEFQIKSLRYNDDEIITIPITATNNLSSGQASFTIEISEGNGFDANPINISFNTQEFQAPNVEIVDYQFSSEEGVIRSMLEVNLQFAVQNTGKGEAEDISVIMKIPNNVFAANEVDYKIASLKPGEKRILNFSFFTNKRFRSDVLDVIADVSEKYNKYSNDLTMSVKMEQEISTSTKLNIESEYNQDTEVIKRFSLTSHVDKNIPTNSKVNNRFALVIGNEDYQSKQSTLSSEQNVDYAVNDATIFKKYCLNTLGVKEENMFDLINATAGEMSQEIDLISKILSKLGDEAELIVYYAGHGFPDELTKIPYLIPVDVSATNLSSAIKLSEIYTKLSSTGARKVTVFLDACFTGGGRNSGLIASRGVKVKPKEGSLSGNLVVFSASSKDQSALPHHKEGHGMFTYHLLKKLQETKGDVSMGELSDYLDDNVSLLSLKENKKEQDPKVNTSSKVINDWRNWKF